MSEQDRQISEAVSRERLRLRNFIRKRVADIGDADDILQEVFFELVEAYRHMRPIEHVSAWLFQVARNRITDLFRRSQRERVFSSTSLSDDKDGALSADFLPSPDAGPEAEYARRMLLEELDDALDELPDEQREVFIAHELMGYSFKEISARTGIGVNTLISRKHYAVVQLRKRLRNIYDEFKGR